MSVEDVQDRIIKRLNDEVEACKPVVGQRWGDGDEGYWEGLKAAAEIVRSTPFENPTFQSRVLPWLHECFGEAVSSDKAERAHRFVEEALELVQAAGITRAECLQLVDYVYGRPAGEIAQEVGGVMTTLAAFCLAHGLSMHDAGEAELVRVWGKIDVIRAKQAAKPKNSPLPEVAR